MPGNLEPFESYTIKGACSDNQKTHHIAIQDNDKVLEFVFEDDITWITGKRSKTFSTT